MKVVRALVITLVLGLAGVSGRGVAQAEESHFTTIDDPLAAHGTQVFGINSRGEIVGEYFDGTFAAHGFLLSHGD